MVATGLSKADLEAMTVVEVQALVTAIEKANKRR
jgi:hypothetical protein